MFPTFIVGNMNGYLDWNQGDCDILTYKGFILFESKIIFVMFRAKTIEMDAFQFSEKSYIERKLAIENNRDMLSGISRY